MKKLIIGITAAAILSICTSTALAAPSVIVNNQTLQLDQPPVIVDSRILVPMRAIFEALGCDVSWDDITQTIVAEKDLNDISLQVGNDTFYVGSKELKLDVPAQIINNRTMAPLRAVSEALGANVSWDADTETVQVSLSEEGSYQYETKKFTQTTGAVSVDMAYPQFKDTSNAILADLNSQLAAAARTRAAAFQQTVKEAGAETPFPCSVTEQYAVKYNKKPYFSILFQNVQNTGGAHPSTVRNAITYDMTTGKALALTDILTGGQAAIDQLISDGFSAQIKAAPENFYPDAAKYLQKAIAAKAYRFYLTDTGLTIYLQVYDIAPYAAGFQEFTIPFRQSDAFQLKF